MLRYILRSLPWYQNFVSNERYSANNWSLKQRRISLISTDGLYVLSTTYNKLCLSHVVRFMWNTISRTHCSKNVSDLRRGCSDWYSILHLLSTTHRHTLFLKFPWSTRVVDEKRVLDFDISAKFYPLGDFIFEEIHADFRNKISLKIKTWIWLLQSNYQNYYQNFIIFFMF